MSDFSDEITTYSQSIQKQVVEAQEKFILDFFGSADAVKEFGHLYQLEIKEYTPLATAKINETSLKTSIEIRLKLKEVNP